MAIFANNVVETITPAAEAVSTVSAQNRIITILTIGLLLSLIVSIASVLSLSSATKRFATEARLTYVKLDPSGTWALTQDMDASVLYYEATLRQVLYDWIERRYSERPASILDDWGIASAMYTPSMQTWFLGTFGAHQKASEIAECKTCPPVSVKVRSHQHVDPLPSSPGSAISEPVRTLIYADRSTGPNRERRIYRVSWRLLSKEAIQSRPDVLRYNPIGVEILEVEESIDETPAP